MLLTCRRIGSSASRMGVSTPAFSQLHAVATTTWGPRSRYFSTRLVIKSPGISSRLNSSISSSSFIRFSPYWS